MRTTDELAQIRDELTAHLRELDRACTGLVTEVERPLGGTVEGDRPALPIQPADLASHRAGEEAALGVLTVEEHLRTEIVDALTRLERNRYGVCERCGKRIAKERLRALPYARYCVPCARAPEPTG